MSDNSDQTKVPFMRHLEWLIFEGRKDLEIQKFYDNIQFPLPNDDLIELAREKVEDIVLPPITKRNFARNYYTAQDRAIFKKYGYEEIYLRSMNQDHLKMEWEMVGRVLNHPVMRLAMECALIVGLGTEEIVDLLPVQFSIAINQAAIELYIKYFFNFRDMQKYDWREYLKMLHENPIAYERIYAALTKSRDEVLFMVKLPNKTQYSTFLKNVLATADYKFRYYSRHNSPEANAASEKWAKIGFKAGELEDKYSGSDMTDFAKLVQTEFQYIDAPIQDITPEMLAEVKPTVATDEQKGPNAPPPPVLPAPHSSNDPDNI